MVLFFTSGQLVLPRVQVCCCFLSDNLYLQVLSPLPGWWKAILAILLSILSRIKPTRLSLLFAFYGWGTHSFCHLNERTSLCALHAWLLLSRQLLSQKCHQVWVLFRSYQIWDSGSWNRNWLFPPNVPLVPTLSFLLLSLGSYSMCCCMSLRCCDS